MIDRPARARLLSLCVLRASAAGAWLTAQRMLVLRLEARWLVWSSPSRSTVLCVRPSQSSARRSSAVSLELSSEATRVSLAMSRRQHVPDDIVHHLLAELGYRASEHGSAGPFDVLGAGTYGTVVRAYTSQRGATVAVKLMTAKSRRDYETVMAEVEVLELARRRSCRHLIHAVSDAVWYPARVDLRTLLESRPETWAYVAVAMPCISGGTLHDYMKLEDRPALTTLSYLHQLAQALNELAELYPQAPERQSHKDVRYDVILG